MKNILRHSLITLSIILAILLALSLVLPLILDPDIYRDAITREVEHKTGRTLKLGTMELSIFPWLGVQINDVQLGNPAGFHPQQMLAAKKLQLHVRLLPLLRGEIHVGEISLDTLQINLARNKEGNTNWADLQKKFSQPTPAAQDKQPDTAPASSPPPSIDKTADTINLPALEIDGINVINARLIWNDEQKQRTYEINRLKLEVGKLQTEKFFPLAASFNFTSDQPAATGQISFSTTVDFSPVSKTVRLREVNLREKIKSPLIPGGLLDVTTQAESISLFTDKQLLEVSNLESRVFNARIISSARITSLFDQPVYDARIEVATFSPRKLAQAFKLKLPSSADPGVLGTLALATKIKGNTGKLKLETLKLKLDDTTIQGQLAVQFKKQPLLTFKLTTDQLDLDRYLPADKKQKAATGTKPARKKPSTSKEVPQTESPAHSLAGLSRIDLQGNLRIQKLKVSNLRLEQINIPVRNQKGHMTLAPVKARLYQGTSRSNITLISNKTQPRFRLEQQLSNIQLAPLLKDLIGEAKASGIANLEALLSTKGLDANTLKANLNGTAKFNLKDGEVKGINIPEMERKINKALKGQAAAASASTATAFSDARGTATIKNGIISNRDLRASLSHARIAGLGQVSLPASTIDYTLLVKFTSEKTGQSGTRYDQMDKAPLPVHIRGPLNKPSIKPDYEAILRELAKRELKKQEKKAKKRLEEEINKKLSNELEKLFKQK